MDHRRKKIKALTETIEEGLKQRILCRVFEYGRTQKDLAKRAGVSESTISRILWKQTKLDPETRRKVHEGLEKFEDSTYPIPLDMHLAMGDITKASQTIRSRVNRAIEQRDHMAGALFNAHERIEELETEVEHLKGVAVRFSEEAMKLRDRLNPQEELPLGDTQWGPP